MAKTFDDTVHILGKSGAPTISLEANCTLRIGANGGEGYVAVFSKDANRTDLNRAPSFVLEAETGRFWVGTKNRAGEILMFPKELDQGDPKRATVQLDAQRAELRLGNNGQAGHVFLFPDDGNRTNSPTASIHLDGSKGDIILRNGDAAEDFDIDETDTVDPGTVVVIGDDARLHECRQSYDKRVAGVIAGAGDSRPGLLLGRKVSMRRRLPVALLGRVCCKADAQYGRIELGDLLTTSPTTGHAMKASDSARAFGAVLGKAMGPLEEGQGLVPVLVALQ
jgi:hypothetical protein